ncbi:MAG: type I secretion system permease/ATPase [Betaproteobacteria bacterium]|nr:type I secretion system permease/ATPase [Betaproteobacteria bacterium]
MSTIDIDVATGKPLTAREQKKREAKEAARKQSEKHGEASRLSKALWKFKREIAWIGFFSLIANALLIAPAIYNLQVYDRVMVYHNEVTLVVLTAVLVMLFGFAAISEWLRSRLMVRMGIRFDEHLNSAVFKASFDAYLRKPGIRTLEAFNDLTHVRQFLTGPGLYAIFDMPWAPLYITILFVMHPFLGWTAIFFAVLNTLVAVIGQRHSAEMTQAAQDLNADQSMFLQSKLRNIEIVESLGMVGALRERWGGLYERQAQAHAKLQHVGHYFAAVMKFLGQIQGSLILGVAAILMIERELTMGGMAAANILMGQATRPFGMIAGSWRGFLQARHAYHRLEAVLEEGIERGGSHRAEQLRGDIVVREFSAYADGREKPILDRLDFEVRPGEVMAIVGPSGAGKSTLVRALLGIWSDTEGEISIDNVRIETWDRENLGGFFGYLPQNVELFDAKVSENIARMGEVDADAVVEASKKAGLHDIILRLPQGYDTPLGEQGGVLSGGQRQRLGLARALYGNPRIVVLDEPNANLDDAGEAALSQAIGQLKEAGCTVVMVLHQRNLLSRADTIMAIDQGRIVFRGSPAELAALRKPG